MKKQLVYTESEHDTFCDFIEFLNKLSEELDDANELTHDREEMLKKTQDMASTLMDLFPVEDN